MTRFRDAVARHVEDIAAKYLIPGETQDMALMFVPSEAVYAELHERLPELIQRAYRARVVIVSPNMLMLAVQTMQAIFKDVRMREQAGLIQREVGHLMTDVARLAERVQDLDKHFTLAVKDVEKILTSTDKIAQRAKRIDGVDLKDDAEEAPAAPRLAAGE
jgi:DNA recombination protein RmuC